MRCYRGVIIVIDGKRRQALIDRSQEDVEALRRHLSTLVVHGELVHVDGLPALDGWKRTGTKALPIWEYAAPHEIGQKLTRITAFNL